MILLDGLIEWYTGWKGVGPGRSLDEGHHRRVGWVEMRGCML